MSKKLVSMVLAGIFLLAFGYLAGTFSISSASAQKIIEYKVVTGTPSSQDCQATLNKMAAEGWEFHSALPVVGHLIFKR
jgi:hypothetical protein